MAATPPPRDGATLTEPVSQTQPTTPAPSASSEPLQSAPIAYARFWRRVLAWLIDIVLLYLLADLVTLPINNGFALLGIGFAISGAYLSLMESSAMQATLGKRALDLVVTDLHGRRISLPRAVGRFLAKCLSSVVLGLGYLSAAWNSKSQALHDILASTVVVRRTDVHRAAIDLADYRPPEG